MRGLILHGFRLQNPTNTPMRIQAFRGLLPRPDLAAAVAAVPYDVVDTEEARALAVGRPYDLLHVDRAEIDLPPDTNPYSPLVYETAAKNLRKLIADGVLQREAAPALYLYQQIMDGRAQTGLIAACHIDDYGNDIIRKHEKTRQVKEDDRTNLVRALSAHTGPIFLTYRDRADVNARSADILATTAPLFDFTAPDGIAHKVWRVADSAPFVSAFDEVPLSYVADGHHRSASAWRVGTERRAANPGHNGEEDYNWFLGVLFPAQQLKIMAYNRAVLDLNGLDPREFLAGLESAGFTRTATTADSPASPASICMYFQGSWHLLTWDTALLTDPVESLDVSILQSRILAPLLGIADPRTSDRIEFIGGIRGTSGLVKKVDSGAAAVAFSMYPTTVDQLMAIADAGQIMPPKSTWFEPKLRSGLVVQTF
jgi:uncharacterized protein (DUF1015 family)